MPSAENPADVPSRWWEPVESWTSRQAGVEQQPPPVSEIHLAWLPAWPEDTLFFLHL